MPPFAKELSTASQVSARSALSAFPEWRGMKLLCAQAQGMYWFLVMRSDLDPARGDISVVKGRIIGAAPWVDLGLKRLLVAAGINEERDGVTIAPVLYPIRAKASTNFGLMAAKALQERLIDRFWATEWGLPSPSKAVLGKLSWTFEEATGQRSASITQWPRLP